MLLIVIGQFQSPCVIQNMTVAEFNTSPEAGSHTVMRVFAHKLKTQSTDFAIPSKDYILVRKWFQSQYHPEDDQPDKSNFFRQYDGSTYTRISQEISIFQTNRAFSETISGRARDVIEQVAHTQSPNTKEKVADLSMPYYHCCQNPH